MMTRTRWFGEAESIVTLSIPLLGIGTSATHPKGGRSATSLIAVINVAVGQTPSALLSPLSSRNENVPSALRTMLPLLITVMSTVPKPITWKL